MSGDRCGGHVISGSTTEELSVSGHTRRIRQLPVTRQEQVSTREDSKDYYQYKEVTLDDDCSLTEDDEGLEATVKVTWEHAEGTGSVDHSIFKDAHKLSQIPETVDDFLQNFFIKTRMHGMLQSSQTEWHDTAQKGELRAELVEIYQRLPSSRVTRIALNAKHNLIVLFPRQIKEKCHGKTRK
uniref:Uncharacterized protein n=1 Tax=Paramormyrops kingsleyae TaxID=1676925 RepID=A0A3B3QAM2_9TELE